MTRQRRLIVEVFDETGGHVSAEEIHTVVATRDAGVSLATVYNTLAALVELGELGEVRDRRGPIRYDPNRTPHHHLLCETCGSLTDIEPVDPGDAIARAARRHGFAIESVDVVVRGRCRACAGRGHPAAG